MRRHQLTFCLLLFVLAAITAKAESININSKEDWETLCDDVRNNSNDYKDILIKLTSDISVTTMLGTDGTKFRGIIDGDGHTITVNYGTAASPLTEEVAGPFRVVDGITISNLHVKGAIYTAAKFAGGFVGRSYGNCTFTNCQSSVTINSSVVGDGTHGGFVAVTTDNSSLTFTDCWFDGKLLGLSTNSCGGFVGWKTGPVIINNCLFDPSEVTFGGSYSYTFSRNNATTITKSYYTDQFGGKQGVQVVQKQPTKGLYSVVHAINGKDYYAPASVTNVSDRIEYTGEEIAVNFDVVTADAVTCTEGTDYSAVITNSKGETVTSIVDADTYTITVNSKDSGLLSGTTEVTFTVYLRWEGGGSGTEADPYLIKSADDWVSLSWITNSINFSGTYFKLTADIKVERSINNFCGIFDGDGHTVEYSGYNYNSMAIGGGDAPFTSPNGATIKNLHTTGTIRSTAMFCGGIAGKLYGNCRIENCSSDMLFICMDHYDGTNAGSRLHGGLVGEIEDDASLVIDNCMFTGWFRGDSSDDYSCAGFVGSNRGNLTITNSFCIPLEKGDYGISSPPRQFSMGINGSDVTNSYHSNYGSQGTFITSSITGGENVNVTITSAPFITYNGTAYYAPGTKVQMTYAGDTFYRYNVNTGSISLPYERDGEHELTGFDKDVVITVTEAIAYVVIDDDNTTMTFYYDNHATTREGRQFIIEPEKNSQSWLDAKDDTENPLINSVTKVVFDPSFASFRPKNTSNWFSSFSSLTTFEGIENLNTSEVTSMSGMFFYCTSLMTLDLSHFDTRKVQHMNLMFYSCKDLTTIYCSDLWNTDAVNNGSDDRMFGGAISLKGGKGSTLSNCDMTVKYARPDGGEGHRGLLTLVSGYAVYDNGTLSFYCDRDADSRTGTKYPLNAAGQLPGWHDVAADITSVNITEGFYALPTTTYAWFEGCSQLTDIDLSNLRTSSVKEIARMFSGCANLANIDMSTFTSAQYTSTNSLFKGCSSLTTLDLSTLNTSEVTDMASMFEGCGNLSTVLIGNNWETGKVTSSDNMFLDCNKLRGYFGTTYDANHTNADYARSDGGAASPGYFTTTDAKEYAIYNSVDKTLRFVHDEQGSNRTLDAADQVFVLNTGSDLPAWNAIAGDVQSVVFEESFATFAPKTMAHWFDGFTSLTSMPDFTNLNTTAVTNMSGLFKGCTWLTKYDSNILNTTAVTDMSSMFEGCTSLRTFDTRKFNTAAATDMSSLFKGCTDLAVLYYDGTNWTTANLTASDDMFADCTSLHGGYGTTYDADHTDKEYARADYVNSPGYLFWFENSIYVTFNSTTHELTYRISNDGFVEDFTNDEMKYVYSQPLLEAQPGWVNNPKNDYTVRRKIEKVVFDQSFSIYHPNSIRHWFYDFQKLTTIEGLEYLHTENVTDMSEMFWNAQSIQTLDLRALNTSNVTDFSKMFQYCYSLESIDLSKFDTRKAQFMGDMFWSCRNLKALDLTSFKTSTVTDMGSMFRDCKALTTIYVSEGWSTTSVTNDYQMFYTSINLKGCYGTTYNEDHIDATYARPDMPYAPGYLTLIADTPYALYADGTLTFRKDDQCFVRKENGEFAYVLNKANELPGWNEKSSDITSVVFDNSFSGVSPTSTYAWFKDCNQLTDIDLSKLNTTKVADMSSMFQGCTSLTTITAGDNWTTNAVTASSNMFDGCENLKGSNGTVYSADHTDAAYAHVDGGVAYPGYFTDVVAAYSVYADGTQTLYYDNLRGLREGQKNSISADKGAWSSNELYNNTTKIIIDESFSGFLPTNMSYWFSYKNLTEIEGLENLNTSEATTMYGLFQGSQSLENIDISNLNTSKVENMKSMFEYCQKLKEVKLGSIDVRNVTTMNQMFSQCYLLERIDLSGLNPEKLEDMYQMFNQCKALKEVTFGNFYAPNVSKIDELFYGCNSLEEADLRSLKTFNNSTAYNLFSYCQNLKYVNMSGIDLSEVTSLSYWFSNCENLQTIDMSGCKLDMDGAIKNHKDNMFYNVPATCLIYLPTGTTKEFFGSDACLYSDAGYYHGNYNIVTDEDGDGNYYCPDFRLFSNIVFRITTPFFADEARYSRSFDENSNTDANGLDYQRTTIYLPFAFNAKDFGLVYDFKAMTAENDGIVLNEVLTSTTTANTPYFIDPNGEQIRAYEVQVETFQNTAVTSGNQMLGTCENTYIPVGGFYYDYNDNKLKQVTAEDDVWQSAETAYFLLPDADPAKAVDGLIVTIEEVDTHINTVDAANEADDADWYTLSGTRLSSKPFQRGIYIHHGRKVVVK